MKQINITYALLITFLLGVTSVQAQEDGSLPDGLGEAPTGHLTFAENKGQIQYSNNQMVSSISYGCQQFSLELYAHTQGKVSFVDRISDDPNTPRGPFTIRMLEMQLVSNFEAPEPVEVDPIATEMTTHISNYYFADTTGDTGVHHYQRIIYEEVYDDIDMHLYSNAAGYKFYFVIHPGGNPDDILMQFNGQDSIDVDSTQLALYNNGLQFALTQAIAYQYGSGVITPLNWTPDYQEPGEGIVGFITQSYDTKLPLVIQIGHPVAPQMLGNNAQNGNPDHLGWSTYISGSSQDEVRGASTGANGEFYHYGFTRSKDYPNASGSMAHPGGDKGFILKFDKDQILTNSLFYGDTHYTEVTGLVELSNGDVVFAGSTSGEAPKGAQVLKPGKTSGFVVNYSSNLTVLAGVTKLAYLSNANNNYVTDLALKDNGNVVAVGYTEGVMAIPQFTFVNPGGFAYFKDTLGGGYEGFIAEVTPGSTQPVWCTALGSTGNDFIRSVSSLENNVFIGMQTTSQSSESLCLGSPTNKIPLCTAGGYSQSYRGGTSDHYIAQFNNSGALQHATYLGGSGAEGESIDVVALTTGGVAVTGATTTINNFTESSIPGGYTWQSANSADQVGYVLEFGGGYTLDYHTYLGCDATNSVTVAQSVVESNDGALYIFGSSGCTTPVGSSNYCTPPSSSATEFPICDFSNQMWLQEDAGAPANKGGNDGFIVGLDDVRDMVWSTWYGGNSSEQKVNVAYDSFGDQLFINGQTNSSTKFPLKKLATVGSYYSGVNPNLGYMGGFAAKFPVNLINLKKEEVDSKTPVEFYVFPNPATNSISFSANMVGSTFRLLDIFGRSIKLGTLTQNSINVGELSVGVYFVEIQFGTSKETVKFVKD